MNIKTRIIDIYKNDHLGESTAITKKRFLDQYGAELDWIPERQFRLLLASFDDNNLPEIPICTGPTGGFWPKSLHEVRRWEATERKRALSVLSRIKRVREYHEQRFKLKAYQMILEGTDKMYNG